MKSEKSDIFIENILILSYSMTLGGEPIKVDEYYETGQVTEFRYCIKVGEGVKNGFFNLPNFYDPVSIMPKTSISWKSIWIYLKSQIEF